MPDNYAGKTGSVPVASQGLSGLPETASVRFPDGRGGLLPPPTSLSTPKVALAPGGRRLTASDRKNGPPLWCPPASKLYLLGGRHDSLNATGPARSARRCGGGAWETPSRSTFRRPFSCSFSYSVNRRPGPPGHWASQSWGARLKWWDQQGNLDRDEGSALNAGISGGGYPPSGPLAPTTTPAPTLSPTPRRGGLSCGSGIAGRSLAGLTIWVT